MADYYCALPVLSYSLNSAFPRSEAFCSQIPNQAVLLFPLTLQLRNELLYKETLIHLMGPWSSPKMHELTDPKLKKLAETAYNQICGMVMEVYKFLFNLTSASAFSSTGDAARRLIEAAQFEVHKQYGRVCMPAFYRKLAETRPEGNPTWFSAYAGRLTNCSLKLNTTTAVAGQGEYMDHFLCLETSGIELPWDETVLDW